MQPQDQTGFCVLVTPRTDADLIGELQRELEVQTSQSLGIVEAQDSSVGDLLERLRSSEQTVVLIQGLESWSDDQFCLLT